MLIDVRLDNMMALAIIEFNTLNGEQDTLQNLTAIYGGRSISSRGRKARNKEEEVRFLHVFCLHCIHRIPFSASFFLHGCIIKKDFFRVLFRINRQLLEMALWQIIVFVT